MGDYSYGPLNGKYLLTSLVSHNSSKTLTKGLEGTFILRPSTGLDLWVGTNRVGTHSREERLSTLQEPKEWSSFGDIGRRDTDTGEKCDRMSPDMSVLVTLHTDSGSGRTSSRLFVKTRTVGRITARIGSGRCTRSPTSSL